MLFYIRIILNDHVNIYYDYTIAEVETYVLRDRKSVV